MNSDEFNALRWWGYVGGPKFLPRRRSGYRAAQKRERRLERAQARSTTAIRLYLEAEAAAFGPSLDELVGAIRRGRFSPEQRAKYDILARVVYGLRAGRISPPLDSIGTALGRDGKAALRLEQRGAKLAADEARETRAPCKRHAVFEGDCPYCLARGQDGDLQGKSS